MKKVLISVMILFLFLSLSFTSLAAQPHYTILLNDNTENGISLNIGLQNNTGIVSQRFSINFDESILEFIGATDLEKLNGFTEPSPALTSPYVLRWVDPFTTTDNKYNGVVATAEFKLKDGVSEGTETEISIKYVEANKLSGNSFEKVPFQDNGVKLKVVDGALQITGYDIDPSANNSFGNLFSLQNLLVICICVAAIVIIIIIVIVTVIVRRNKNKENVKIKDKVETDNIVVENKEMVEDTNNNDNNENLKETTQESNVSDNIIENNNSDSND